MEMCSYINPTTAGVFIETMPQFPDWAKKNDWLTTVAITADNFSIKPTLTEPNAPELAVFSELKRSLCTNESQESFSFEGMKGIKSDEEIAYKMFASDDKVNLAYYEFPAAGKTDMRPLCSSTAGERIVLPDIRISD